MQLIKINRTFERGAAADIEKTISEQLSAQLRCKPGAQIAIAVGSRGIAHLARIVKATVEGVRKQGGVPFVVPAMGSHGGATADGQLQVLASYGVVPEFINCPIHSSMEVVELPQGKLAHKLFMDRHACEADGVILINRIKPHTDFHGVYESGLAKMSVIGLGKERQAREIHRHGIYGLKELIPRAASVMFASGQIVLGIGIVENAYDEISIIEAIAPPEIMKREPELLEQARRNMPALPTDQLDVLIIDRMGKDISGAGIDTNIIGRLRIRGGAEPATPCIKMIIVLDLTIASHGNATGIGLADVTTRRLFEKIDFPVTYTNTVTSTFLERGKLPVVAETDQMALAYAIRACGPSPAEQLKIIRIKDTLHLDELYVSQAVLAEIKGRAEIRITREPANLFDETGNLPQF
ncbi:MAG: hypothetical protein WKF30_01710 [Pyrinomonadaceae bacterium]